MPFDATVFSLPTSLDDHLIALDITPIPLRVVDAHKRQVIREFSTSMRGRSLVRNRAAMWRTLHLYRDLDILERPKKHIGPTIDVSPAPRPIIELARKVSRELKDAEFEMEWFYTDPVLNVVRGGQRACLGIWDKGRIVAIANRDGHIPPGPVERRADQAFWRRCLGMLWR